MGGSAKLQRELPETMNLPGGGDGRREDLEERVAWSRPDKSSELVDDAARSQQGDPAHMAAIKAQAIKQRQEVQAMISMAMAEDDGVGLGVHLKQSNEHPGPTVEQQL